MDKPSQTPSLPFLSLVFYSLAILLTLMILSAWFDLPTATIIGRFFFQAFSLLSLYLPLYLAIIGVYLHKFQPNRWLLIAINLSFFIFITTVLLLRFLHGQNQTEWELALFWHLSKNNRTHFTLLLIVLLLLEITVVSFCWYRSRSTAKSLPSPNDALIIDEQHAALNTTTIIDNSTHIEINTTESAATPEKQHIEAKERVLLRDEKPGNPLGKIFTDGFNKVKESLFGAEKADQEWQKEVESLLDELHEVQTTSTQTSTSLNEEHLDDFQPNEQENSPTLEYLEQDPQLKELLDDPMMEGWQEEVLDTKDHSIPFPTEPVTPNQVDHSLDSVEQERLTTTQALDKDHLSQLINEHLGIEEPATQVVEELEITPPIMNKRPQKLESPQLAIEEDFNNRMENWDDEFLPPHLRGSLFTPEEQAALHAISEEIVENAQLEAQIAELITEANTTLDKIIHNTRLSPGDEESISAQLHQWLEETTPKVKPVATTIQATDHQPTSEIKDNSYTNNENQDLTVTNPDLVADAYIAPLVNDQLVQKNPTSLDEFTANFEIPQNALPNIKEELTVANAPFIHQSLDEEALSSAVTSPTTTPELIGYQLPSHELLDGYTNTPYWEIDDETRELAAILENTLKEFKIEGEVTSISKGPAITMFELLPASGVKLSRIEGLADNIAFRLAAKSVRIVAPIPGKQAVGVEIPNQKRSIVSFKELIDDQQLLANEAIPVVLGKDIAGENQVIDLSKTPHLLIAGATGSGKSVCVNGLISSILFTCKPSEVRLMLIDPKIVELKPFNDVPHLLTPVITDPKRALQAIQWVNDEMDRRYALLDNMGTRNITGYNQRIKDSGLINPPLPYLVVVIDEFADLMATGAKELEGLIARLAAKSRAAGIHLVLATQRPSVDVITGLIKANFPSRIAFMVAGKMDSRVILDANGAEQLLGRGDMLFISSWSPIPTRIQGAFLSDDEVERIADFVKSQGEPNYIDDEIFYDDEESSFDDLSDGESDDVLFEQAVEVVVSSGKASASYLQRRFKIGYNRAARLIELMEERGIVGPANGSKPREVLRSSY